MSMHGQRELPHTRADRTELQRRLGALGVTELERSGITFTSEGPLTRDEIFNLIRDDEFWSAQA